MKKKLLRALVPLTLLAFLFGCAQPVQNAESEQAISLSSQLPPLNNSRGNKGYRKSRWDGSNVYIYETSGNEKVDVDLGIRYKREKLSLLHKRNNLAMAKINAGFFNPGNSKSEYIGTYIDEGLYYNPPNEKHIDFIYYKSGKTEIRPVKKSELSKLQRDCFWVMGTSYSLVINGKKDIRNEENFSHYKYRHPRTLFGQKQDGTFVLVVADGRSSSSKGLTASSSANLMKHLGCYNAVNLDGGGSSEMVVKDKIKNRPSDGSERYIGSAILIYNNSLSYYSYPVIQKGARGEFVYKLQEKLHSKGYFPEKHIIGIFGPITKSAVIKFQKANNLSANGVVNRDTWKAVLK